MRLTLLQHHADLSHHMLVPHSVPLPPTGLSQSPLISCCFNPILSGWEQMPSGDLSEEAGPTQS